MTRRRRVDPPATPGEMRRLIADVPRGGAQRHPPASGWSTDPLCPDADPDHVVGRLDPEWRTT